MQNKKFGFIKTKRGYDKQFICLNLKDGSKKTYIGYEPKHFHGIFALVKDDNNDIHLLTEDNDFFNTKFIVSKRDLMDLFNILKILTSMFELLPKNQSRFTANYQNKSININRFTAKLEFVNSTKTDVLVRIFDCYGIEMKFTVNNVDSLMNLIATTVKVKLNYYNNALVI